jgi:hypothetical protein
MSWSLIQGVLPYVYKKDYETEIGGQGPVGAVELQGKKVPYVHLL